MIAWLDDPHHKNTSGETGFVEWHILILTSRFFMFLYWRMFYAWIDWDTNRFAFNISVHSLRAAHTRVYTRNGLCYHTLPVTNRPIQFVFCFVFYFFCPSLFPGRYWKPKGHLLVEHNYSIFVSDERFSAPVRSSAEQLEKAVREHLTFNINNTYT